MRIVPQETLASQARASDPDNSAWVSANAGSGKTHVLAQRVIRLLLSGTDPSRILCLTYTRAAAANMAQRVFDNLGRWTRLPDEELAAAIHSLEGRQPDRQTLASARRLFARALETPGGLKIQTIHAFCEAVLQRFPLEANIGGHFELLDSAMEAALLAEARRSLLTGSVSGTDAALSAALADVLALGGEKGLEDLLSEILTRRDGLRSLIDQIGNDPVPFSAIFAEFGFGEGEDARAICEGRWPLPGFSADEFAAFVAVAVETDAASLLKNLVPKAQMAFAEPDPVRRFELLREGFLTGKAEPYKQTAFKKALCARLPDIYERYVAAANVITETADRLALYRMLEATRAALVLADRLIARYERLKRARGFLDFNDLIARTVTLLSRNDAGPWIQYKLDQGLDHILIDEAQDTSPGQWQIVKLLTEEFFTGEGARADVRRTVFAVGDEKQSIYSFQGAEPAAFAENRVLFDTRTTDSGRVFRRESLRHSFRSAEAVLTAVDMVFDAEAMRRGLTTDQEPMQHIPIRDSAPGYVELWSSLSPIEVEEPDDWTQSIDHASAPAVRLAETIADTIRQWIATGEPIKETGRPIRPGDIMVLVRKRDRFVHALSRSLKNRRVDVAGADRLRLTAHIAVKDLLALGRFIMQPNDELSLAAILRSPVFDLAEERLFALAWHRGTASLFDALRRGASTDPGLAAITAQLEAWRNAAAFRPVFEFYAGVLSGSPGEAGVRSKMVARLGHEADDILDEFLTFCLASERAGLAGLEALLAALDGAAPEIKREMDQTRDEVRIMTVHAAKGLEAPVVFLVDPGSAPFSASHLPRLMAFEGTSGAWQGPGYLWRAGKDVANAACRRLEGEAKERAEQEYRRLLYVGMTRAEDRLIVCGYRGKKPPATPTWHGMVEAGFAAGDVVTLDHPEACAPVLRFSIGTAAKGSETQAAGQTAPRESAALPDALREAVEPPALPRPLAPSGTAALIESSSDQAVSPNSPVLDAAAEPSFAIQRGLAVHKMLQLLPGVDAERRETAARNYLSRAGAAWAPGEREAAWRSVAAILGDPAHAPLFSAQSRAEVSVMGTLTLGGKPRAVSGKIDRLAVLEDRILIVDYKTNRPSPSVLADVPPAYVAQIALYAELLKPLYPGKQILGALLFTDAPRLIPVDTGAMEHALARLGGT